MSNYIEWRMAIVRSSLPPYAKYLGLYLNTFMNPRQDVAWPSIATIEGETGLSRKTVIKYLGVLEEAGWISRQKRFGKSILYVSHVPSSVLAPLLEQVHHSSVPPPPSVVDVVHPNKQMNRQVNKQRGRAFVPPSVSEVRDYCRERGNRVDAESFVDFYQSKGWLIGKNKVSDWKACVRTWEKRNATSKRNSTEQSFLETCQAYAAGELD